MRGVKVTVRSPHALLHQARPVAPQATHAVQAPGRRALFRGGLRDRGIRGPDLDDLPHPPTDPGHRVEDGLRDQARIRRDRHDADAPPRLQADATEGRPHLRTRGRHGQRGRGNVDLRAGRTDAVPLQERPGGRVPLRALRNRHGLHPVRNPHLRAEGLHRDPQGHHLSDGVRRTGGRRTQSEVHLLRDRERFPHPSATPVPLEEDQSVPRAFAVL